MSDLVEGLYFIYSYPDFVRTVNKYRLDSIKVYQEQGKIINKCIFFCKFLKRAVSTHEKFNADMSAFRNIAWSVFTIIFRIWTNVFLGDRGVSGRILFKMCLKEKMCENVDWIRQAQDLEKWRALTNTILQLRFPWDVGKFLTGLRPLETPRTTLHGVKYELFKSSRMYYKNMKRSSQERRIYEGDHFASAVKFKHFAIISYKPHFHHLWTEVSADSNIRVLVQFWSPRSIPRWSGRCCVNMRHC